MHAVKRPNGQFSPEQEKAISNIFYKGNETFKNEGRRKESHFITDITNCMLWDTQLSPQ